MAAPARAVLAELTPAGLRAQPIFDCATPLIPGLLPLNRASFFERAFPPRAKCDGIPSEPVANVAAITRPADTARCGHRVWQTARELGGGCASRSDHRVRRPRIRRGIPAPRSPNPVRPPRARRRHSPLGRPRRLPPCRPALGHARCKRRSPLPTPTTRSSRLRAPSSGRPMRTCRRLSPAGARPWCWPEAAATRAAHQPVDLGHRCDWHSGNRQR